MVQMGIRLAFGGREAQGRSGEFEEAGGGLRNHCGETLGRD